MNFNELNKKEQKLINDQFSQKHKKGEIIDVIENLIVSLDNKYTYNELFSVYINLFNK